VRMAMRRGRHLCYVVGVEAHVAAELAKLPYRAGSAKGFDVTRANRDRAVDERSDRRGQIARNVDGSTRAEEDRNPAAREALFFQPLDLAFSDNCFKLIAFVEDHFSIVAPAGQAGLIDDSWRRRGAEALVWQ